MRNLFTRAVYGTLALGLAAGLQLLSPAATLSVSPSTVSNLYGGDITLQIGGLTNG